MPLILNDNDHEVLLINQKQYNIFNLSYIEKYFGTIKNLPKSLKIILENIMRCQNDRDTRIKDIKAIVKWQKNAHIEHEISYYPVRVLMQDFTGIPAIVDLATMRESVKKLNGDATKINPYIPVDLVIDHSITVDYFGSDNSFKKNLQLEMQRNYERYKFLKWGQNTFNNFRVIPPSTGICHQVNLEYLGKIVCLEKINNKNFIWPDTVIGTDSHTTMINALGILGWGTGGIEAEAAMLGQPLSMLIPDVVGFKLIGKLRSGITATDLVLTITQMLREHGVVDKFVEFYGDGLDNLPLVDRGTIANMAPEYGATCAFFPVDQVTIDYMELTGRSNKHINLIKIYTKKQGMWRNSGEEPIFTNTICLDLNKVNISISGPHRPHDRVSLSNVPNIFTKNLLSNIKVSTANKNIEYVDPKTGLKHILSHGTIIICAITSCTNTSNHNLLITAGLLAKKAVDLGLKKQPWVKTSLAPGSKVVSNYLNHTKLTKYLDKLGFTLVGYGCTTCIGNSGPIEPEIETVIKQNNLIVSAVLSGNRNFEGRIHPLIKHNWLASPALVIVYALVGNITCNLETDPIGQDHKGNNIFLKDIWPSNEEIVNLTKKITKNMFIQENSNMFLGTKAWRDIQTKKSLTYEWDKNSTYIQFAPFLDDIKKIPEKMQDIKNARILAIFGNFITTDHISPAGNIKIDSPAGTYLLSNNIKYKDFNSYGARRGNHEVMIRGTFANIRIKNEILPQIEGGYTKHYPSEQQLTIYDAAMKYKEDKVPLVIIAGKAYGSGSSRDWAAKGPCLLGIKVIIAESFERIHRSNLIGMGILPLRFTEGTTRFTWNFTGSEIITINNLMQLEPKCMVKVTIMNINGEKKEFNTICCINTKSELTYYKHGGILKNVIRNILNT
ncbi:MAG: aconitate hydratase AcnA [Pantoea sp. Brub]|nr:aconitate hydratase AcnA [Pantoea sp. Brub]